MSMTVDLMATTLFWIAMAFMLPGFILMTIFYRRLKNRHLEIWRGLGSPSFFLNASIRNQQMVSRFVWRNQYKELKDPGLNKIVLWIKLVGILTFAALLSAVVISIFAAAA